MRAVITALLRRLSRGGVVLCFHSVTTGEWPSASPVHLPLADFERTVRLAEELGTIVPLADIVMRHKAGRSTAGLVAITCDDAYAALLYAAGDFVRRRAVPVTIFVIAEAGRSGTSYWWDRVDDVFPALSAECWRQFEDECGLPEAFRQGQPRDLGPLRPFRQWMLAEHKGIWPRALEPKLAALERTVGVSTRHRSMTYDELTKFVADAPVTIGVHTVSHPVLPLLSDDAVRAEILSCFGQLRERFACSLPLLAAPFGLFDARTLRLASECGMSATLTLAGITLRRSSRQWGIPRFCQVADQRPWRAALQLSGIAGRVSWGRWAGQQFPALPSAAT